MTKAERKLLSNIATLICVLSRNEVVQLEVDICNDMCDGSQVKKSAIKKQRQELKEYLSLIIETEHLAHDIVIE